MTLEAWQTYTFTWTGCWTVVQMERVEGSRLAGHTRLASPDNRHDLWPIIILITARRRANGCHVGNSTPGANGEAWTSNAAPTIPGRTSSSGKWIIHFWYSYIPTPSPQFPYVYTWDVMFFGPIEHGARLRRASRRSRNAVGRARCQRTPTAPPRFPQYLQSER